MKAIRTNKKLSQKEVAQNIGIPQTEYSNIENGKIEPTLSMLEKITEYFGVPITELFETVNTFESKELPTIPTFSALKFNTKNFKFNREEANLR
jgi:transcriptional regulator with XRE-family HTH domain